MELKLLPAKSTYKDDHYKNNGHPILVIDNFNQIGRDNFTNLVLSAYEIYQANTSIAKH